jgi:hypothetical protein
LADLSSNVQWFAGGPELRIFTYIVTYLILTTGSIFDEGMALMVATARAQFRRALAAGIDRPSSVRST